MSKKLLFKGGHRTGMTPYEIEDFLSLYMRDARVDEKTKAYIDSVIGNSVLNLCPYRNVLVTHKYDTVEGNVVTLDDCQDDEIIQLSEIQGNTMVNCNKDTDKELILMPNLDTNGYSNVTITEGVDGGKVDVSLEGNTMVNVCDQEEAIAITKSYTVDTGNHIALQGEYDGKCRPNIYGNTMVNLVSNSNLWGVGCSGDVNTDYTITSADTQGIVINKLTDNVSYLYFKKKIDPSLFKPSTTYTIIFNSSKTNNVGIVTGNTAEILLPLKPCNDGYNIVKITSTDLSTITGKNDLYLYLAVDKQYIGTVKASDFIVLEGDYTNKPIPDYFTGMKSSFEDKLIPENLSSSVSYNGQINKKYATLCTVDASKLKRNTIYTTFIKNDGEEDIQVYSNNTGGNFNFSTFTVSAKSSKVMIISTKDSELDTTKKVWLSLYSTETLPQNISAYLVEGDYTNYDFTDYDSTKGGKYKVDYKVTGKNLFDGKYVCGYLQGGEVNVYKEGIPNNAPETRSAIVKVPKNTDIYMSKEDSSRSVIGLFTNYPKNNDPYTLIVGSNSQTINTGDYNYIVIYVSNENEEPKLQIEEGTTVTTYEPYKETIKTLYLNSPLLEGDTIEQSGNNIIHVHRYTSVVFDGSDDEGWTIVPDNYAPSNTDYTIFYMDNNCKLLGIVYCDKIPTSTDKYITGSSPNSFAIGSHTSGKSIRICIEKSKLSSVDVVGFKQWLQQNPITVVYELATPTQEIISTNDNLLLDSYTNGHLDVDTVIPIDKVKFNTHTALKLNYLYESTNYIIQFESDNIGSASLSIGGKYINAFNVTKGVNKINVATKDTPNSQYLGFNGIGFNASKIVVTPKVDNNFRYFKGMKSVGECEDNKIEILSSKNIAPPSSYRYTNYGIEFNFGSKIIDENVYVHNVSDKFIMVHTSINQQYSRGFKIKKNSKKLIELNEGEVIYCASVNRSDGWNDGDVEKARNSFIITKKENEINKKEILLNEPLRGLPNGVRDKYVIIDGKWYIERNTVEILLDNSIINIGISTMDFTNKNIQLFFIGKFKNILKRTPNNDTVPNLFSDKFNANAYNILYEKNIEGAAITQNGEIGISILKSKLSTVDIDGFKQWLTNNPTKVICELAQPTYEPIDYNPFELYTDTTHISNNSTIPCNMVIRNSGFNCILKPNTKYTVSSNNGLSTVTTKDSIGDSILRFYNKDTSKITKMSNVLVLEGDYITGNPPIPAFFKGMESAFEQELVTDEKDKNYGKYKVKVLAKNKNLFTSEVIDALCTLENWVGNGAYKNNYVAYKLMNFKAGTTYTNTIPEIKVPPHFYPILFLDRIKNGHFLASGWYQNDTDNEKIVSANTFTFTLENDGNFRAYVNPWNDENMQKLRKVLEQNIQTEIGKTSTEFVEPKQNNITFYINEQLRGVGNVKDKVYVKEDKVVVERNCASVTFDSSKDEGWFKDQLTNQYTDGSFIASCKTKDMKKNTQTSIGGIVDNLPNVSMSSQIYNGKTLSTNCYSSGWGQHYICLKNISTLDEFKTWLQQNPTTVVYELTTPVYEEVECDLSKLALEGYNNGTLFYNSNIPVTTQFYDFNVNIKDMLIPNETYYITFIADRVKDITINLSGVQVNYKTSMGYNKVPVQLGDIVNTNFSMDSRGVELSDLMISTSTSLIYVKDMNDVCIYDEASNKYSITITSTGGNESDKRVILLDYPLLRLNKDVYDRLYYSNKDSRYRIDKKVFKHKFTNEHEYSKYAAETNDTYYSSFISLNENIKDYVVITNEKVKTVKVEDGKYYFKIKWSDLGVSDKTETNGNQGMKDFFNNNEVYLYYATDGFVEIIDGLRRQTLKVYQPETTMNFLGNTTTTVTIVIPKKNI